MNTLIFQNFVSKSFFSLLLLGFLCPDTLFPLFLYCIFALSPSLSNSSPHTSASPNPRLPWAKLIYDFQLLYLGQYCNTRPSPLPKYNLLMDTRAGEKPFVLALHSRAAHYQIKKDIQVADYGLSHGN